MAIVRFDCYELDPAAGQLRRRGSKLRLRDQPVQVLSMLLQHPGEVVTREELHHLLWPNDIDVDFDNNLNTAIGRIREALGDSSRHPRFIETLPRRGYRFIGKVVEEMQERPKLRLLVLPFVNSSGDPSQEYFSDAMTDEVIAELSTFAPDRLAVIARTTAMHYKGSHKDVSRIARELSLDYVVEGSTRQNVNRVTLTVQLIRVADQAHLFARRYDVDLGNIFDLQRAAARALGAQIAAGRFEPQTAAVAPPQERKRPTRDLDAYNSYILGRYHLDKGASPQGWKIARECMEDAIRRDPEFALAYDGLAELWWLTGFIGVVPPKVALSTGVVYAMRALEIDSSLAEAHAMLAQYVKQLAFDWEQVTREMDLAMQLNPFSPVVRMRRAVTGLMPLGLIDESIADLDVSLEVDPLAAWPRFWSCVMLGLGRHYERAIEQGRIAHAVAPTHVPGHIALGLTLLSAGQLDESISVFARLADLTHDAPLALGWFGLAKAENGDHEGARALLNRLRVTPEGVFVPPTSHAWIHLGLGEIDEFFEWMDRAVEMRDHMIMPIKTYPFMDRIRDDRRYIPLLQSMNLA